MMPEAWGARIQRQMTLCSFVSETYTDIVLPLKENRKGCDSVKSNIIWSQVATINLIRLLAYQFDVNCE